MTRLYIVRHAEAEGNKMHTFQGSTDAGISERGYQQLEKLKERFKNIDFDRVYSSPLKRAYITAQYADFYKKLPITVVDGIREINAGDWEKKSFITLPDEYPEECNAWALEPWNFKSPNGETMREVYDRVWKATLEIVKTNPNKKVLVTSHGCAIRNLVCHCYGYPLENLRDVNWIENTGITTVDFDENLKPTVVKFNDFTHLTKEDLTLGNSGWWKNCVSEKAIKNK